jgi:hypothetical protein
MGRLYSTHENEKYVHRLGQKTCKNETTWETFVIMDLEDIILGCLDWVCVRRQSHDGHV